MTSSRRLVVFAAAAAVVCVVSCKRSTTTDAPDASVVSTTAISSVPAGMVAVGTPRPGMAWVPAGTFRAGTDPGSAPRVADEELPGVAIEMRGFHIDLFPYPNEPGAIPTSNVTRDEAEQLCATKGKRLCTELEWERACKGPTSTVYEYGDAYRAASCETGTSVEESARRAAGERHHCKSTFGVAEMHGGVWEWTASSWGRGSKDASLGVLRGGNSTAGELVGRCANGLARASSKKSPTMGLRCCAGAKNEVEVKLDLKGGGGVGAAADWVSDVWGSELTPLIGIVDPPSRRAWTWSPVQNEDLVIVMACSPGTTLPRGCALVVGAMRGNTRAVLAKTIVGHDLPELSRAGDARHLRIRSLDGRGVFSRDVTYVYGRVELGEPKRP